MPSLPIAFKDTIPPNWRRTAKPPELRYLPAQRHITLDAVVVRGLPVSESAPWVQPTRKSATLWSLSVGEVLPLQFELSLDQKNCQVTLAYVGVDNWSRIATVHVLDDKPSFKNISDELVHKIKERETTVEECKKEFRKSPADKAQRKPWIEALEKLNERINSLNVQIHKLDRLKHTAQNLWEKGELHYQISMTIDGNEVILADTRQPEPKK